MNMLTASPATSQSTSTDSRSKWFSNIVMPTNLAEVADACRASKRLVPLGGLTKRSLVLSDPADAEVTAIDMRGYRGVVNYDPSEFLISARGGTTLQELADVLAAQGQYLPYDPVMIARGSTLGGSIASGISGPCRLLYGNLRDFMLEVALCDGTGREVRGGGKVVKNAAGFDLPKLVVGSYGRLGIITEATLKVFPKPTGWITLTIDCGSLRAALELGMRLLAMPLPIAALEIERAAIVQLRLAGPLDSLDGMASRIRSQTGRLPVSVVQPSEEEANLWLKRSEFAWAEPAELLVRVAVTHHQCSPLIAGLAALGSPSDCVLSCGAAVAWLAFQDRQALPAIDALLSEQKLAGVVIRGSDTLTLVGDKRWTAATARIQAALNDAGKYLPFQANSN